MKSSPVRARQWTPSRKKCTRNLRVQLKIEKTCGTESLLSFLRGKPQRGSQRTATRVTVEGLTLTLRNRLGTVSTLYPSTRRISATLPSPTCAFFSSIYPLKHHSMAKVNMMGWVHHVCKSMVGLNFLIVIGPKLP